MSMTCQHCNERYALSRSVQVDGGERKFLCISCASQLPVQPRHFPEGTMQGRPANDFADHERESLARAAEVAAAQREAIARCMADLLALFSREIGNGYTTAEQQQALRYARAMLAEVGL